MSSRSLSEIVGIKDKIIELLNEPSLNKVCDSVCTFLFIAMVINIFTERDWELVLNVIGIILIVGTFGYFYKKYNLRTQILEDARKKDNIEFDHQIQNPKLKETEIYLDRMDAVHDEIVHLRTHFQQLTGVLANKIVRVEDDGSVDSVKEVNDAVNGDATVEETEETVKESVEETTDESIEEPVEESSTSEEII